jgi:hypothetical protein
MDSSNEPAAATTVPTTLVAMPTLSPAAPAGSSLTLISLPSITVSGDEQTYLPDPSGAGDIAE